MSSAEIQVVLILLGSVILGVILAYIENKKVKKLRRYQDINIGMSENQMLNIMGKGYTRNILKNNRIKYEWRINASTYKGVRTNVRKVSIYTKNGKVCDVTTHNI